MSGGWGSSWGSKKESDDKSFEDIPWRTGKMPTNKPTLPTTKAERDQKKKEANALIARKFEEIHRLLGDVAKIADDAQISVYFRGVGYGAGATYYPNVKEDTARRVALEKLTVEERELLGLPGDLSEVFELEENDWNEEDEGSWVPSSSSGC